MGEEEEFNMLKNVLVVRLSLGWGGGGGREEFKIRMSLLSG